MEDSGEVQSEENKVSPDVNKKRTVKTPEQVMALEKLYKEYRFPSDETKAQMAVQVGLTEKQISSWFCHRRLKDKKRDGYANGRLDHSSGVIHDRGSGLRQDSSGIMEQDYRNIDPREVESGRISSTDHVFDLRRHQNPYDAHMEDTSSESSSPLQDMCFFESRDPYNLPTSVKLRQNGAILPINSRTTKNKVYKPSGYLKVKGESENPAITAVKRQLGRYYLEDGPILCIEFDPLPNGAFDFPSGKSISAEAVDDGDHERPCSPHISGVIKQPNLNIINVHNSKMRSQDSYMENATFKTMYGSERRNKKPRHQLKYKSSFLCSNSFPGQNSSSDIHKGSAEKAGITDYKQSRMRLDSFSNHPSPNGGRIDNERENPCLCGDDNYIYKAPKNKTPSKISNSVHECIESLGTERGPSPMMGKVQAEELGGERKPEMEYPERVKTDPANESRVAKQVDVQFPQQDFVSNASHERSPLLTNPTKRSSMDVPSSFSEDETAETSSSSD